jgi:hypothetical protein
LGSKFGKKIMARDKRFSMWKILGDEELFIALERKYPELNRSQLVRMALRKLLENS